MHERMEFPWKVKEVDGIEPEGLTYIGHPDGTETVDPECLAAKALPDLIEALKMAEGVLAALGDKGYVSAVAVAEEARKALKKAGIEVET